MKCKIRNRVLIYLSLIIIYLVVLLDFHTHQDGETHGCTEWCCVYELSNVTPEESMLEILFPFF